MEKVEKNKIRHIGTITYTTTFELVWLETGDELDRKVGF